MVGLETRVTWEGENVVFWSLSAREIDRQLRDERAKVVRRRIVWCFGMLCLGVIVVLSNLLIQFAVSVP